MDAELAKMFERDALRDAFTAHSCENLYLNDDDKIEYDPDTDGSHLCFDAKVISRIIAAREANNAEEVMFFAGLLSEQLVDALIKLSNTPAGRHAYTPDKVALVRVIRNADGKPIGAVPEKFIKPIQKVTASKRRTRDSLAFGKREQMEVEHLMSKGLTRIQAERKWRAEEMEREFPNFRPGTPAYRRERKNLGQRGRNAAKVLAREASP